MKVAILSNATVEVLSGMLRERASAWTPPGFGAWMECALNPPPELAAFNPDLVVLLLDGHFAALPEKAHVESAEASLRAAFPGAAVIVPDVASILSDLGDAAYDERMWSLAGMPWSIDALHELAKVVVPAKKALALDLDNTLWKGVVSEDGVAGIAPDAELQRTALALRRRGVLLVALSKNDAEDVDPVWEDPRMVLGKDDFVAMRIDWNEKSANLADVARELNIGADSFVFVDDNAGNRAEMRAAMPEVAVAPFPPDLGVYFPFGAATAEDGARTELYRDEAKRRKAKAGMTYDEYIRYLDIRCDVRELAGEDIARVAQLAQKTNQMNVCLNRWSEDEVRAFASDPARRIFTLRASDRFGDLGLVGFVHVVLRSAEAEVVDWVMSCRAMNRRIEVAFEREVERRLSAMGARRLSATWRKGAKNGPSRDLFDRLGFSTSADSEDERRYGIILGVGGTHEEDRGI